MTVMTSHQCK